MVLRAAFLVCMLLAPAYGQGLHVERVVIGEKGIFRAEGSVVEFAAGVRRIQKPMLVQATDEIPARRGVRFGLRYILQGRPFGVPAKLELITRFPGRGLVGHPGGALAEHRYSAEINIGVPQYRDYSFDEHYELVPGMWVFEFWHSGRKLGEQQFCVYDIDTARRCSY